MPHAAEYLVFRVNGFTCALPVRDVEHVSGMVALDPLPGLPLAVIGSCRFHGDVAFGVDISPALGLERHTFDARARVLVTRSAGLVLGILADAVGDIVTPPPADARRDASRSFTGAIPPLPSGARVSCVRGMFFSDATPVYIIAVDGLLSDSDRFILAQLLRTIPSPS